MYETILAATDGSEPANRAIDHAADLASTFDADLHVIYVVDTRRYGESMLADSETVIAELEEQGADILREIETRADVGVTTEIRSGRPHNQIGEYADEIDADLLVIGNRGLGAGGEIGSTAERVVRYVDRPVITPNSGTETKASRVSTREPHVRCVDDSGVSYLAGFDVGASTRCTTLYSSRPTGAIRRTALSNT